MKKRKKEKVVPSAGYLIQFCDLSTDLDRKLRWLAELISVDEFETYSFGTETGHYLIEYLMRRAALEHVFLGRPLYEIQNDRSQLQAEIWRMNKIRARMNLKSVSRG